MNGTRRPISFQPVLRSRFLFLQSIALSLLGAWGLWEYDNNPYLQQWDLSTFLLLGFGLTMIIGLFGVWLVLKNESEKGKNARTALPSA